MSNAPSSVTSCVLFVGIAPERLPAAVVSRLEDAHHHLVYCGDVYRAMARVRALDPAAVVVLVDWMSRDEFAFFEIVIRANRDRPVYALSIESAQRKIDQAVRYGARVATSFAQIADRLAPAVQVKPSVARPAAEAIRPPDSPPPRPQTSNLRTEGGDAEIIRTENFRKSPETLASPGNVFDAALDKRLRELASTDRPPRFEDSVEEELSGRDEIGDWDSAALGMDEPAVESGEARGSDDALDEPDATLKDGQTKGTVAENMTRVPWLRYNGGPTRVAPSNAERPTHECRDRDDSPLLSSEELDELLGDHPEPDAES